MQSGEPLTADEANAYFMGLKGCYNAVDLNRVESKVRELASRLDGYGYRNKIITYTRWKIADIVHYSDVARYLANIAMLKRIYHVYPTSPPVPTVKQWIGYIQANAIEKILVDIESLVDLMIQTFISSGTIKSDEKNLWGSFPQKYYIPQRQSGTFNLGGNGL